VGNTLTKRAIGPLGFLAGATPLGFLEWVPLDALRASGDPRTALAAAVPAPAASVDRVRRPDTVDAPPAGRPAPRPEPTVPRPEPEVGDAPDCDRAPLDVEAVAGAAVGFAVEDEDESWLGADAGRVAAVNVGTVGVGVLGSEDVLTDGVLTGGVVTLGVLSCGVVSGPTVTDGTVADGTVADGTVAEGTVTDGTVSVETETVSPPIDAALASAAPASSAAASTNAPDTARGIRPRLRMRTHRSKTLKRTMRLQIAHPLLCRSAFPAHETPPQA
jgi:hypothetical protein